MNRDTFSFVFIFAFTFLSMQLVQFYFTKNVSDKVEVLQYSEEESSPSDLIQQNYHRAFSFDRADLIFDEQTGHIVGLSLGDFWVDIKQSQKVNTLFKNQADEQVLTQDVLYIDPDTRKIQLVPFNRAEFDYDQESKTLTVTRKHPLMTMIEHYSLDGSSPYGFNRKTEITPHTDLTYYLYTELKNTHKALIEGTQEGSRMFQGASFHTTKTKYKKLPFQQFAKNSFNESADDGGWLSFSQRYFVTAIKLDYPGKFYTKYLSPNETYIAGHLSAEINGQSGKNESFVQRVYSGPENQKYLSAFAPSLELVVDYGFFWPICHLVLAVMIFIHSFIQNWGFSIIIGTLLIRTILAFLTSKQAQSMKKMQSVQPKIDALKQTYKDDQVAFSQAMMALYQNEGINPLSSFLSALSAPLVQIPIFFAFYSVLMETVDLRQAPFIGWIVDLSSKDPYFILPFFVAVTAYLQQRMGPKPQEETMALFMQIMPIMLGVFCVNLPAGLSLYWLTSNLFSIVQAWRMSSGQQLSPLGAQ